MSSLLGATYLGDGRAEVLVWASAPRWAGGRGSAPAMGRLAGRSFAVFSREGPE